MSTKVAPSLSTLPVELLYRLLDYLDIQTILLSFRYVSRTFYAISNSSSRYHLDLSATSKSHFDFICRRICSERVLSITLSNEDPSPGQISLFFSLFRITDFLQLRSLTLRHIDAKDLPQILNDLLRCSLTSLTFHSTGKRNKSIFRLLSILIAQSNLQILSLNSHAHHTEGMFNTVSQSHLVRLTIGTLTFNEYRSVLRHCPHLRTLILDDCWMNDIERDSSIISSQQVTSLTLKDTNRSMTQLETLLPLTPSLVELKIINSPLTPSSLIDGCRWEALIKKNLLSLNEFQFVFHQLFLRIYECPTDVEFLVTPFRTSFWLEDKKWFVDCQAIKSSHMIRLYSIPFSVTSYDYNFDPGNILLSTSTQRLHPSLIMDHVRCLSLNLTEIKSKQIQKQIVKRENLPFCRVSELKLRVDGEWPADFLYLMSTLIDPLILRTFSFQSNFDPSIVSIIIDHLVAILHWAPNLDSLALLPSSVNGQYHTDTVTLCSIVSTEIKNLTLKVQKLDDMKVVVNNLHHLSSVAFNFPSDRKINSNEMIDYLTYEGRDFTYLQNEYSLHLWLGKISHRR